MFKTKEKIQRLNAKIEELESEIKGIKSANDGLYKILQNAQIIYEDWYLDQLAPRRKFSDDMQGIIDYLKIEKITKPSRTYFRKKQK